MRPALPWLRQGDIFEVVPHAAILAYDDGIASRTDEVTAVLITENCQLDKRSRAGVISVSRLQFAPVRPFEELDANICGMLRRKEVSPPEAVPIGEIDGREFFFYLGEIYTLPPSYFTLVSEDFEGYEEADASDPFHAVARNHGERIGTMDADLVKLMWLKMARFWMKADLNPDDLVDP